MTSPDLRIPPGAPPPPHQVLGVARSHKINERRDTWFNTHRPMIGFAIRETTGAGAELNIYAGQDADGVLKLPILLAPNESIREWFGPSGIAFPDGIFVELVAGQIRGVVFTG